MGVLSSADPYSTSATGNRPNPRQLLDTGADQVQRELAGEPGLQAELLTMMGRTYRRLGSYAKAEGLLEQALAGARSAFGPEHLRVAQALQDLGVVHGDRGHYADARRCLEDALAMRRRLQPEGDAELGVLLAELGRVYQDLRLDDRAESMHREGLAVRTTVARRRPSRDGCQREQPRISAAPARRSRRRRGVASPLARGEHRHAWTAASERGDDTPRPGADRVRAGRLRSRRGRTA